MLAACGESRSTSIGAPLAPESRPPDAIAPHATEPRAISGVAAPTGIPYRCPPPPPRAPCDARTPEWIGELYRLAFLIHTSEDGPRHDPPPQIHCERAAATIATGLAADPNTLTSEERVVAQASAWLLAVSRCNDPTKPHARPAARLAVALALDQPAAARLGDQPMPEIERWIGPRTGWRDFQTKQVPLVHDLADHFTTRFRPVRSGELRAIFGQLAGFDRDGTVFVTPLVSRIELRLSTDHTAPACVVKLDPTRLRCAERLHALELDQLPPADSTRLTAFAFRLRQDPTQPSCITCHSPRSRDVAGVGPENPVHGDLELLAPDSAASHLDARRKAFFEGAQQRVIEVRRLAR